MTRAERRRIAYRLKVEADGKTVKSYCRSGIDANSKTEWRREYKRIRRRQRGGLSRAEIAEKAKEKRDFEALKMESQRALKMLHDAHVKQFKERERNRARMASLYQLNPGKQRARQRERKQALVDSYVVQNLVASGIPRVEISPYMIELKREQMQLRRLALELKQSAAKTRKEHYETVAKHT